MNRASRVQAFILVAFFLIAGPYLFDIAYCEELASLPVSQGVLIDGENVDPNEEGASGASVDFAITRDGNDLSPSSFERRSCVDPCQFRTPILSMGASRAPPFTP